MPCPRCHQDNPPQTRFCPECGTPLRGAVPAAGSYVELQAENENLKRSLGEALEQQTATAEILRVISTSPTDLQPVLDAVVRSAARFCQAPDAQIYHMEDGSLKLAAHHGPIPTEMGRVIPVGGGTATSRAVLERRAVHVSDLFAEAGEFPVGDRHAREFGFRSVLAAPLLREATVVGTINLRRIEVSPFTDKQIALLQTFADQAVIAIENVRLFKELQAKNRDLTEALDQQTATSEVLKVISRSTFDLQPVLDTLVENATRLCEAEHGSIHRVKGNTFPLAAAYGHSPELYDFIKQNPPRAERKSVAGRVVLQRQ